MITGYLVINAQRKYWRRQASLITAGRWVDLPKDATEFTNYETAEVVAVQFEGTSVPAFVISATPAQRELPL